MTDIPDDVPSNPENSLNKRHTAASRTGLSEEERAAALNAGHTPVSQAFVVKAVLILAAVLFVGLAIEHFFGNTGTPHASRATSTFSSTTTTTPLPGQLPSPLENLLGLRYIAPSSASAFSLTDQGGHVWQLANYHGQVVILTFFDSNCKDICPVLGAEVRQANELLGGAKSHVIFAIVNTSLVNRGVQPNPPALTTTGLATASNVYFLTGSLAQLNTVWSNYGVQIRLNTSGVESHNNVIYFITAAGKLKALAVPFGNESPTGKFTLSPGETHLFAQGIAQFVTSLEHS